MNEKNCPWNWREKVLDFLKPDSRVLDLFPGDGTFLLSLRHPGELCRTLPQPEDPLPFEGNSFDIVLDNGGRYSLSEVHRVLKPGGFFLVQQFGSEHMFSLRRLLSLSVPERQDYNLENELPRFRNAGFRIMYRNQAYPILYFSSVEEALAYLPGKEEALRPGLEKHFASHDFLETEEHRFFIIGKKR